jgi:archaellum component FlaF (FlaF/FlaG flagellin family)
MQCRNTKKTLTPVRSTGILICIAIAVSLATLAWMNGLPTPNIQTEDLQVTNYQLGSNFSFVDVTLYNNGTQSTKIKSITVDSQPTTVAYIDGSDQINLGESAVVRIANAFAPEETYQIEIQTTKGSKFIYTVTA